MKKIQLVLTIAFMTIAITTYSQTKDKDVMIKSIFEALKNKNEEAFLKLFPSVATLKEILQTSFKNADEKLQDIIGGMTDSSLQAHIRKDFRGTIEDGEDNGINWPAAALTSYTADSVMSNDEIMKSNTLSGKIFFKAGDKDFFISYNEVIWFEGRGWYGVSLRRIGQMVNGEEVYADAMADSSDSTAVADTVARAVDVKPVKKPAAPVKNKPVQKKAATPARKPE